MDDETTPCKLYFIIFYGVLTVRCDKIHRDFSGIPDESSDFIDSYSSFNK